MAAKQGFTSILANGLNSISFIADNTVKNVAVSTTGAPDIEFREGGARQFFQAGNGINIESIMLRFPYQYTKSESMMLLTLQYANRSKSWFSAVVELSPAGQLFIPTVDAMYDLNQFIEYPPGAGGEDWYLRIAGATIFVSQLTAPDLLNTLELPIFANLTVHSTEDMIS